jgi:hypothetical protein
MMKIANLLMEIIVVQLIAIFSGREGEAIEATTIASPHRTFQGSPALGRGDCAPPKNIRLENHPLH